MYIFVIDSTSMLIWIITDMDENAAIHFSDKREELKICLLNCEEDK